MKISRKSGNEFWYDKDFKLKKKHNNKFELSKAFPTGKLWGDEIHEDDTMQGDMGNCWFVGAVSSASTNEQLIKSIFPDHEKQEDATDG